MAKTYLANKSWITKMYSLPRAVTGGPCRSIAIKSLQCQETILRLGLGFIAGAACCCWQLLQLDTKSLTSSLREGQKKIEWHLSMDLRPLRWPAWGTEWIKERISCFRVRSTTIRGDHGSFLRNNNPLPSWKNVCLHLTRWL
jgi:hypothetical protein